MNQKLTISGIVVLLVALGMVAGFRRSDWHSSPTATRPDESGSIPSSLIRFEADSNAVVSMPNGSLVRLLFVQMGTKGSQVLARMEADEWVELTHTQTREIQISRLGEVYWDTATRREPTSPHLTSVMLLLQFVELAPGPEINLSFRDASTGWKIDKPGYWASDPVATGQQEKRSYYLAGAELPILHSARIEVEVSYKDQKHGDCIGVFILPSLLGVPDSNLTPGDLFDVVIPQIELQNIHDMRRAISNYAQVTLPKAPVFTDGFPRSYTDVTVRELTREFARYHRRNGHLSFDSAKHEFAFHKTWWRDWTSKIRNWQF
ncbi:MAG: hypothetical protein AAGH89_12185 [Verrucomicrobiota bacterium]